MTLETPSLKELAASISERASTVQDYLEKNGKQQPSFGSDGLRTYDFSEIAEARLQLAEAATDMLQLALGPTEWMQVQALTLKWDQYVLSALNNWNVFDKVPLDGSISYVELAKECDVPEARLRRIIKHAMTNRIFWGPTLDTVAHTALSAVSLRQPMLYAWIAHNIDECGLSAFKLTEAIERWGDSSDPKETAMMMAYRDHDKNFDSYFALMGDEGEGEPSVAILEGEVDKADRTKGWRARRSGNAMKYMTENGPQFKTTVHAGFDWNSLGKAKVVDIGGSIGHISVEVASKNPNLEFVVQDFAELEPQFNKTVPEALKSRIKFEVHDFFTPQTAKAGVFFMKHILHDWPDALCVKILQNIASVMQKENRILVVDSVMPEIGEAPISVVKANTSLDLQMMAGLNAKERTKKDWIELFGSADKRLTIKAFNKPPGSAATLIEVVFEG